MLICIYSFYPVLHVTSRFFLKIVKMWVSPLVHDAIQLMCRFVQVMEHCILFNVGPYLMMALISLYLIFINREDHIFSRKKCIANQFVDRIILHFPLNSLHLSNIRYSYTLTEMSLVERNDLNFVVKSSTVHLVGQAIVHITTEPSTTKLVAFTVLRHMSP